MMRNLIIYAHPKHDSLNYSLLELVKHELEKRNQEVVVRDLYQLNFNPVLSAADLDGQLSGHLAEEVKQEQEYLKWAERILLIYPIWWTGMPAILKGYIDRVFTYGFAYCYEQGVQKGLLGNRETIILSTHGKSAQEYEDNGFNKAISLTSDTGIFTYCGLQLKKHFFIDRANRMDAETFAQWQAQLQDCF